MDFWHVMNRGVDKRTLVQNDRDRLRFVKDLLVLNDVSRVENSNYFLNHEALHPTGKRERLVTIHAWCLMGNHYHMLLSEAVDQGVSLFLKKFNAGYSKYFNKKYDRSGALFQGKTKRVLIRNERQFLYILPYIHLNPLDLAKGSKGWREQCLVNPRSGLKWVTEYRWSSYRNYVHENEFTEILEGSELFADRKEHAKELERFLNAMHGNTFAELNLE